MRQNDSLSPALIYSWIDGTAGVDLQWDQSHNPPEPNKIDIEKCVRIDRPYILTPTQTEEIWLLKSTKCSLRHYYLCT